MKSYLTLLFLFYLHYCTAQVIYQEGYARLINSDKQPLAGVFIKFEESASANTDDNGFFRLAFVDRKAGDLIFLEEIHKSGYELVNNKDFEITKISSSENLLTDIILAPTGQLEAAKKEYYGVSDKALRTAFENEKKKLRQQLRNAELDQAYFLMQIKDLEQKFESQRKSLNALAEKFSRINFDDVGSTYKSALLLFQSGKIEEAIQMLENEEPGRRTEEILHEEKRIELAEAEINEQKQALAKAKKEQIQSILLLIDLYRVNFEINKSIDQFDQLIALDSSNVDILIAAAFFYKSVYQYEKSERLALKILNNRDINQMEKANMFALLGELYEKLSRIDKAKNAYDSCFSIYNNLYNTNPTTPFFKSALSLSYILRAQLLNEKNKWEESIDLLKESIALQEELINTYPDKINYLKDLSKSFSILSSTTRNAGRLFESIQISQIAKSIADSIHQLQYDHEYSLNVLSQIYLNKSLAYNGLGLLDSAFHLVGESLKMKKSLLDLSPNDPQRKYQYANALASSITTYTTFLELDSILYGLNKAHSIFLSLSNQFPENAEFQDARARSHIHISKHFMEQGETEKAQLYLDSSLIIYKKIIAQYPEGIAYELNYGAALETKCKLKGLQNNLSSAIECYSLRLQMAQSLLHKDTASFLAHDHFLTALNLLGDAFEQKNELDSAMYYYERARTHLSELIQKYPDRDHLKLLLAKNDSYLYTIMKKGGLISEAFNHLTSNTGIVYELTEKYPENIHYTLELIHSIGDLVEMLYDFGIYEECIPLLKSRIEMDKVFVEAFPNQPKYLAQYAFGHGKLGDVHIELDSLQNAWEHYTEYLNLQLKAHSINPNNQRKYNLALAYYKVGDLHKREKNKAAAKTYFRRASEQLSAIPSPSNLDIRVMNFQSFLSKEIVSLKE